MKGNFSLSQSTLTLQEIREIKMCVGKIGVRGTRLTKRGLCLHKTSLFDKQITEIVMSLREIRTNGNRLAIDSFRIIQSASQHQQITEVGITAGVLRILRYRTTPMRLGLVESIQAIATHRGEIQRFGIRIRLIYLITQRFKRFNEPLAGVKRRCCAV
nr:hypothetical protein [Caballeronia sp. GAWG1-1]